MPDTQDLLAEIASLRALPEQTQAANLRKDARIATLEKLVAAFKQAAFGKRSEKADPDQFDLALEDIETAMAAVYAEEDTEDRKAQRPGPKSVTPTAARCPPICSGSRLWLNLTA